MYNLNLTPEHLFNLYFNDGRSWESSAEISKQIWTGFAKRLSQDVAEKLQSPRPGVDTFPRVNLNYIHLD